MGSYLLRKLLTLPLTLLLTAFAIFALLSLLPGDPARLVVGPEASPQAYQAVREKLGLDLPWPARFGHWLYGALRGDLGTSLSRGLPVAALVGSSLTVTLPLALMASAIALLIALPLGALAAGRPGGALDLLTVGTAQLGMAIPEFWLGILLMGFLAVRLRAFPAGGFPGWGAPGAALAHLVLPALALALPRAAYLARMIRASLADVLAAPYIRAARGKGLSEPAVIGRHALRNALIPVVTVAGLSLGRLLAGALVVENLFYLPGLGRLALAAVRARDLSLLSGAGLVVAGLILLLTLAVDLAYGALDPRIRYR
ncbi:ABC transporter permease [Candidatus Acetothermia bacterium]|nr:MAG: ABC transporter permease [Candidatus Acetothermia bacterium]